MRSVRVVSREAVSSQCYPRRALAVINKMQVAVGVAWRWVVGGEPVA